MAGYFSTTQRGAGLVAFEAIINPVEQVQTEWHAHVRSLKAALSGKDIEFFKAILVAKRNFRTGRASLLVAHDAWQGITTFSEITFGKYSGKASACTNSSPKPQ